MPDHPTPPELGPGPLFGETHQGFDLLPRTPEAAERDDPVQVALHAQVRRRVARLEPAMQRLRNSHPALDMEFADYKAFIASE